MKILQLILVEWHKLKYGLAIFGILFAGLSAWAINNPKCLANIYWLIFIGFCFVLFMVQVFVADYQQNHFPFLLGMPVSNACIYWVKIITGSIVIIIVELLLRNILERINLPVGYPYTRYIKAIPFLLLPLYIYILLNSVWSRQSAAEMILSTVSFTLLAFINASTLLFYHPLFPRMYIIAAIIQFTLLLIFFNYRIWAKYIMNGRSGIRYFVHAWLLMILIPMLQLIVIFCFTEIYFKIVVREMEKAGFKMVDIPSWQANFVMNYTSITNREEAEKWLKNPDTVYNHRQFIKISREVEDYHGCLYEPFYSSEMYLYLIDAAKVYYLIGDKNNFFKILNYYSVIGHNRHAAVLEAISSLDDSPLNTPEFWSELLDFVKTGRSWEVLVNINGGSLMKQIHHSNKNLYFSISDWVMAPREYYIFLRVFRMKALDGNWPIWYEQYLKDHHESIRMIENKLK